MAPLRASQKTERDAARWAAQPRSLRSLSHRDLPQLATAGEVQSTARPPSSISMLAKLAASGTCSSPNERDDVDLPHSASDPLGHSSVTFWLSITVSHLVPDCSCCSITRSIGVHSALLLLYCHPSTSQTSSNVVFAVLPRASHAGAVRRKEQQQHLLTAGVGTEFRSVIKPDRPEVSSFFLQTVAAGSVQG